MILSKEEHDNLIKELLDLATTTQQVQFLTGLQYEVNAKRIKEAHDNAIRFANESRGIKEALSIVIRELIDGIR